MFSEDFYSQLHFADGSLTGPQLVADIKKTPSDFVVDEILDVEFTNEGEHIWLNISKTKMHTDQIAKSLAHLAGIHAKDIGISGMKDFIAQTSQWFSVWLPGVTDEDLPDWYSLEDDFIKINQVVRHSRKLKRGTHLGNKFEIVLRDFEGDIESFEQRLALIQEQGAPSYFGEQRFGRGGSNLKQAFDALESGRRIKQRQKRSMVLSSARSWLFNCVLSERLKDQSWLQVKEGEPLSLNGSRQFFVSESIEESQQRLLDKDVHTTAPLWGKGEASVLSESDELLNYEQEVLKDYDVFKKGLVKAGLEYTRRALRFFPQDLTWSEKDNNIEINFTLGRGLFATSLLRELVVERK